MGNPSIAINFPGLLPFLYCQSEKKIQPLENSLPQQETAKVLAECSENISLLPEYLP